MPGRCINFKVSGQQLPNRSALNAIMANASILESMAMNKKTLSTRQIINRIYKDIEGFEIPSIDAKRVRESKGSPIYGEINHEALNKLLKYLRLGPKDVFFDLGSGVGKVITQTLLTTPVKLAVGVELSKIRHHDARLAMKRAYDFDPSIKNRVRLLNKDLLTVDLHEATVIYTCSTAFSQLFMKKLTKRLQSFNHHFILVSLQDLPEIPEFKLIKKLKLDMSWLKCTPVYIYQRS